MAVEHWQASLVTWVMTYLLHGTILLGAAWIITSLLSSRLDGLRETIWRFALVGGVLSASMQLWAAPRISGWLGRPESDANWRVDVTALFANDGDDHESWSWPTDEAADSIDVDARGIAASDVASAGDEARPDSPEDRRTIAGGATALLHAALAAAPTVIGLSLLLSSLALAVSIARLRRLLGGRAPVADIAAIRILDELRRGAGVRRRVRLTHSPRLATPVAMGLLRGEICLPSRALETLPPAELESMIAHELAHVVRHDPAWMVIEQVLSTVLFIQPLNLVARRRLRELAEYQCDAWAAAQCRDGLPLARCLTEVAMWLVQARRPVAMRLLPGMSVRQSTLSRRVGRLLDEPPALPMRRPGMVLGALSVAFAAAAMVAPRVQAVVEADLASVPRPDAMHLPAGANELAPMPAPAKTRTDDAAAALAALDLELAELQRQVDELSAAIRGTALEAELTPLLTDFQRSAESIRQRRAALEPRLKNAQVRSPNPDLGPVPPTPGIPDPRDRDTDH